MNWNKKLRGLATQAIAESNSLIYDDFLKKDVMERKAKRVRAKKARKRNRKK